MAPSWKFLANLTYIVQCQGSRCCSKPVVSGTHQWYSGILQYFIVLMLGGPYGDHIESGSIAYKEFDSLSFTLKLNFKGLLFNKKLVNERKIAGNLGMNKGIIDWVFQKLQLVQNGCEYICRGMSDEKQIGNITVSQTDLFYAPFLKIFFLNAYLRKQILKYILYNIYTILYKYMI